MEFSWISSMGLGELEGGLRMLGGGSGSLEEFVIDGKFSLGNGPFGVSSNVT